MEIEEARKIIKYEIARNIIKKMLKAKLITEEEFKKIDTKSKE